MKGKNKLEQELAQMEKATVQLYQRWQFVYENGCKDPNWEDGMNLNLLRNHLLYYKRKMSKLCAENGLDKPQILFRHLPPALPREYMARRDEIWLEAGEALYQIDNSEVVKELRQWSTRLTSQQADKIGISAFFARISYCGIAFGSDQYLVMRNLVQNAEHLLAAADELLKAAKNMPSEPWQLSLFDCV